MKKIEKAGGKVPGEPMEIPGTGLYVSFIDTEGNRASILQPGNMVKDGLNGIGVKIISS